MMEVPARLVVDPIEPTKIADLYLPKERWLELIRLNGGSNRLTVVLRFEEESK